MTTDLRLTLEGHGIRLKSFRPGEHRAMCPACSQTRHKKTDPCLAVKIDDSGGAVWNCHHCQMTGNVPARTSPTAGKHARTSTRRTPPTAILPAASQNRPDDLIAFFLARGISRKTVEHFGIYEDRHWMPGTGKQERCIVFPYLHHGQLVNRKYRDGKKHFAQEKGAARTLFNIDALAGHTTAIIVEGEMDVLALHEAGFTNVVSLPDGAPAKLKEEPQPDDRRFEALATCADDVAHIQHFVIAVDMDGPGNNLAQELVRRLGPERCSRVTWPAVNDVARKDAGETLQHDGQEIVRECLEAAEPYPVAGLYSAADYADELFELYHVGRKAGLSTGLVTLDRILKVRPGDLTVITGIPGHGKSEFLDQLMVNIATDHGWSFAICSFENAPEEQIAKLAEKHLRKPFWDGPSHRMSESDLQKALEWVDKHFKFIRAEEEESPTVEWLMERARLAVLRFGIRGLVIDPWNEIEHRRPAGVTETEYVGATLARLRRFAKAHGVHVWVVAHPRVLYADNKGQRPVPGLYDISGSANWANKPDFGIAVNRPDDNKPFTDIHVLKVRYKWLGQKDFVRLRYKKATGEYFDDLDQVGGVE